MGGRTWRRAVLAAAIGILLGPAPAAGQEEDVEARYRWWLASRVGPDGRIPPGARLKAQRQVEALESQRQPLLGLGVQWEAIGPRPIQNGQVGTEYAERAMAGRVASLVVDPKNPARWFAGAATGGVWETRDAGVSWRTTTDAAASLSIGALAMDENGVIWAGTGEGIYTNPVYPGEGVLRSTDAGNTWQLLGAAALQGGSFAALLVSRSQPLAQQRLVGALLDKGVVLSSDGGTTWRQSQRSTDAGASFIANGGNATALAVDETSGFTRFYAGLGSRGSDLFNGLYRSTDGGEHFVRVTGPWSADLARMGRIEIALSPSDPRVLYVGIAVAGPSSGGNVDQLLGLWVTSDAWAPTPVFTRVNTTATDGRTGTPPVPVLGYCREQCDWDHVLLVDARDPNTLYAGGVGLWRCDSCLSNPNAPTWTEIGRGGSSLANPAADVTHGIHFDQQALAQVVSTGAAEMGSYRQVHEWCEGPSEGGGRRITYPATATAAFDSFTPCNRTLHGTAAGSATMTATPARLEGGTVDPATRRLVLAAPLTVKADVDLTWTAGNTGTTGFSTTLFLETVRRTEPTCQTLETKSVDTGKSVAYRLSLTCEVKTLDDASSLIGPNIYTVDTNVLFNSYDGFQTRRVFSVGFKTVFEVKAGSILIAGNDGGVFSTRDPRGAAPHWDDLNETLAITQFYKGSLHPGNGELALGGTQDNGTVRRDLGLWRQAFGGDGGHNAFSLSGARFAGTYAANPGPPGIFRSHGPARTDAEVANSGLPGSPAFLVPLARCPSNDEVFLTATTDVYRATRFFTAPANVPATPIWSRNNRTLGSLARALAFAPSDLSCGTYIAGAAGADLHLTADGGTTWRSISGTVRGAAAPLPDRVLTSVAFDPQNPSVVWVSLGEFDATAPAGHLFRTTNALAPGGVEWVELTPRDPAGARIDFPFNKVVLDPWNARTVYAAADVGVFRSTDDGATWTALGHTRGLPNAPVHDLVAERDTDSLVAFTHGRGAFRMIPPERADLSIEKTGAPNPVVVGEPLTWRITVRNAGPDPASNVKVYDDLDPSVRIDSVRASQGGCVGDPNLACTLDTIAVGQTATVTAVVIPTREGILTNRAQVVSPTADPDRRDNTATTNVTVLPPAQRADLTITKSHLPPTPLLGGTFTYTLDIRNDGPDGATNVVVTDPLPLDLNLVIARTNRGSCAPGPPVSCALGPLAPTESASVTLEVRPARGGTYLNTATVRATETDPDPQDNSSTDPTVVAAQPIVERVTPASAPQGSRDLEVRVEGSGFVPGAAVSFNPATGIEVVPPLPPNFGFVSFGEVRVVIRVAAGAPLGERQVLVTNPDGRSGGSVLGRGLVIVAGPVIRVVPASLAFGSSRGGRSVEKTLAVFNDGSAPLVVSAIGSSRADYTVLGATAFTVPPGGQQAVSVRFTPRDGGGRPATLVIAANDPVRLGARVPMSGTGTLGPVIQAAPAALDFGDVRLGQSRSLLFSLRNAGDEPLTVGAVNAEGSGFRVSITSLVIVPPGGRLSGEVTFTPAAAGDASGAIVAASDDPARPALRIPLAGAGSNGAQNQLVIDDGTMDIATAGAGVIVVNRFTPSSYPVKLDALRVFIPNANPFPAPVGAAIRLVAFTEPTGAPQSPQRPQLLVNQAATVPNVPAGGAFIDFPVTNGPVVTAGDLYVGFASPNPAGDVVYAADSTGEQQRRGWFSTDGGSTFIGPLVLNPSIRVNIMMRALVSSEPSSCTLGLSPASLELDAFGGSRTVSVTAPAGCPWSATSDAAFLSLTAGGGSQRTPLAASVSGTGNGSFTIAVAPGAGGARSGSVRVGRLSVTVTQSTEKPPAEASLFVPIVLSSSGLAGSFFTSELTLTNRGATPAVFEARYQAAFGGGSGSAFDVLAPGTQRTYPDALAYLAALGVPLPAEGNRGGTLALGFSGMEFPGAAAATVRTTTGVAEGRAGLAYSGFAPAGGGEAVYVCGLRQNAADRSNLALLNTGRPEDGDVTLRVTVFSGDAQESAPLSDVTLAPGGFTQLGGVLGASGLPIANGYARVERVAGKAPFYAYGVVNDQANSDGSFVAPLAPSTLVGRTSQTLPVVVETPAFSSELVITNFGTSTRTVRLALVADALTTADQTARDTLVVGPGRQLVLTDLVQALRDRGVAGLPARGATVAGALFVEADGDVSGLFVGARTSSAGGGGRYGLFYAAVPAGAAARDSAWLFGLQQNTDNRTNVALVNTGEGNGDVDVFRIELHDAASGALVKVVDGIALAARRWTQLTTILAQHAPGVTHGYAKVVRSSGGNPFLAYAVVNDGGQPGQRTGDGAFVAMANVDEPGP